MAPHLTTPKLWAGSGGGTLRPGRRERILAGSAAATFYWRRAVCWQVVKVEARTILRVEQELLCGLETLNLTFNFKNNLFHF